MLMKISVAKTNLANVMIGNIICKSQYVYGNRSNGMINNGI